ncbi:hypothetical protein ACFE04_017399 [Oxalis oulophora]
MTTIDFLTTAFTVYSSVMSLPDIALNKGYVLNPLCKCGYHSVLLTAYTEDNVGKGFFSCGTSEVDISNKCNFFMWFGDVELIGWAKQLVLHLRTSCVEYETKLMATRNEVATQKETMQSMSEELAKTRVELDLLLKEKRQSVEFIRSEMTKFSRGVYDEILSIFGEDEHITDDGSLLCYCDVPALILTSKEANNHKRTLATCSKYNEIEEVSTYTVETYKTWEEEKIAHKSARDRLHYLEYLSKKLIGTRDDLKFSILPTKSVGMRSRRGRPPWKRMVASRSTWTDKNWSGDGDVIFEDDVILEGVPVPKMTKLGL